MHINGYMQVAWTDWRMKWDKDKYPGMDSIKINDYGHLWTPDVYSQRYTHTNYARAHSEHTHTQLLDGHDHR
jgi:hypothetical protein